jgi:hypothetical protein
MTLRRVLLGLIMTIFFLLALGENEVFASGELKALQGDKATVEHGDNPNGVGGVDGVLHPNSGNVPSTNGQSVRSRASGQSRGSSSVRPQP